MTRPSWDSLFMELAHNISKMSTCDRANVGCVLVRDKHIITLSFNGSLPNLPHCNDVGHLMRNGHCLRTTHSEMNAIDWCAKEGIAIKDATLYCTHYPCLNCCKSIISAGIIRVVYDQTYRIDDIAVQFFEQSNVVVERIENV